MKLTREKLIILPLFFLLFPFNLLFSQSEEALKILENNKAAVISLVAYGDKDEILAEGSGFTLEKGIILTNYLLVSQAKSVEGKDFNGKKIKIEAIVGVEKDLFAVLLKAKVKEPALILGDSNELEKEKKVFALGNNEIDQITVSEGTVSNFLEIEAARKFINTSITLPDKSNGGPLLGLNGQVLGINIALERGLKFVVPSYLLRRLQKTSEVKFKDWQHEDYLATQEGAFLAGKISSLLDETGRAQKYLEIAVKSAPEKIEVHSLLASVFSRQRNYEAAVSSYKKVIELDGRRDDAYYAIGLVYLNMRRFQDAIPPLEKAVEINPDLREAYFHVGSAYEELRTFDKAAEFYEKFLNTNPEKPGMTYLHLGLCRFELGLFESAAAAFQEALKENPQDIAVNYRLAKCYEKAGQVEKAAEVYMLLAQLTPEDAFLYYRGILTMFDQAGKTDKAIEIAKKIVELKPGDSDSLFNLGYMYAKEKKYKEAIEAFNKVIEINPNTEYAYGQLGYIYSQLDNWGKSIEAFKKLVELVPDNSDGWFYIGVGYMQLKKYESALEPLLKAIEIRHDFGVAYYNLGITYLNLHDNYSARDTYRKLLKIDPTWAEKLKKSIR